MFKTDEVLRRAYDNHGSFLNSIKHEMLNDFPRQSTDTMDSTYQTWKPSTISNGMNCGIHKHVKKWSQKKKLY